MKNEFIVSESDLNYSRIAEIIEYIQSNFKNQPDLNELASRVNLSPFHFQRIFKEWAGTSPKKFLQFISLDHAKHLLKVERATIFETAIETGLSSTSRLHDLFISIEGMTPAEYKNGGKDLVINFKFYDCLFGKLLIANTEKGICHMAFFEESTEAIKILESKFPNASFNFQSDILQKNALSVLNNSNSPEEKIKLHIKGSDFQLKVWEALLSIPSGHLSTYGNIANNIDNPAASRAVGTAIGNNPVAFLIPCHRVIQSSGAIGGYMWGNVRKTAIIGWENSKYNK